VGEGERLGGAATNSIIFKDSTCSNTVTIMFNCDTLHTNKHYRRTFLHSLPELTTAVVGEIGGVEERVVWRSRNQQQGLHSTSIIVKHAQT